MFEPFNGLPLSPLVRKGYGYKRLHEFRMRISRKRLRQLDIQVTIRIKGKLYNIILICGHASMKDKNER